MNRDKGTGRHSTGRKAFPLGLREWGGGIWGCHHGSAVGIYCAEAKEVNESIISVTQQNTVPPKMPTALQLRKTAGHGL